MKLEFDHKKATQAINFFAQKEGGQIDKLKVIKLIWLADRYHLRKYGRPIVNDSYYAMKLGPVGSAVKDLSGFNVCDAVEEKYLKEYLNSDKTNRINSIKKIDDEVFSDTDLEALENIYKEYGEYQASQLVNISHEFPEWKKFEKILDSKSNTREAMSYSDFFGNPTGDIKVKNIFTETEEELENPKQVFVENYKLASFWL